MKTKNHTQKPVAEWLNTMPHIYMPQIFESATNCILFIDAHIYVEI